jgi:hypothetical protein
MVACNVYSLPREAPRYAFSEPVLQRTLSGGPSSGECSHDNVNLTSASKTARVCQREAPRRIGAHSTEAFLTQGHLSPSTKLRFYTSHTHKHKHKEIWKFGDFHNFHSARFVLCSLLLICTSNSFYSQL